MSAQILQGMPFPHPLFLYSIVIILIREWFINVFHVHERGEGDATINLFICCLCLTLYIPSIGSLCVE